MKPYKRPGQPLQIPEGNALGLFLILLRAFSMKMTHQAAPDDPPQGPSHPEEDPAPVDSEPREQESKLGIIVLGVSELTFHAYNIRAL